MIFEEFLQLDPADLIINIWVYNKDKMHNAICSICQNYSYFAIKALQQKWESEWGDCDYFVKKLIESDEQYINLGQYTASSKHQIIDFIRKYNKKN